MSKGLLIVTTNPPADMEEEFNVWYDREHVPEQLAVPGFERAQRYYLTHGERRYVALYDVSALDVFEVARLSGKVRRRQHAMDEANHFALQFHPRARRAGLSWRCADEPRAATFDPSLRRSRGASRRHRSRCAIRSGGIASVAIACLFGAGDRRRLYPRGRIFGSGGAHPPRHLRGRDRPDRPRQLIRALLKGYGNQLFAIVRHKR